MGTLNLNEMSNYLRSLIRDNGHLRFIHEDNKNIIFFLYLFCAYNPWKYLVDPSGGRGAGRVARAAAKVGWIPCRDCQPVLLFSESSRRDGHCSLG